MFSAAHLWPETLRSLLRYGGSVNQTTLKHYIGTINVSSTKLQTSEFKGAKS